MNIPSLLRSNIGVIATVALLAACGDSDPVDPGTTTDTGDSTDAGTDGQTDRPDITDEPDAGSDADTTAEPDSETPDADTGTTDDVTPSDASDADDSDALDVIDSDGSADGDTGIDPDTESDADTDADTGSDVGDTCGNGIIDEGEDCDDGEANGDVPDACRTTCVEAGCGDGIVDTGEECDDGLDNDDRLANACRTSCQVAFCGDGVLDSGEQCDDGDLNDESGACLPGCSINLAVACEGIDLIEFSAFSAPFGEGEIIDLNLFELDSLQTAPAGCVDGDRADSGELTLVWTPETAGTYRVSTAYQATGVDTVVYVFDDCEGGRLLGCNDNARASTLGSDLVFDAEAGAPYFITVDRVGVGGRVRLSIIPVEAELAGEGEACADVSECDGGLDCALGTCTADTAPQLTGGTARYIPDTDTLILELAGTDPDANVVNVNFPIVRYDDGSDVVGVVLTTPPDVVTDGTDFAISLRIGGISVLSASGAAALESLSSVAVDALGQESEPLDLTAIVVTDPTIVGDGELCDSALADPVCDVGLTCGRQLDGTDICGASIAPTIAEASGAWVSTTQIRLDITVLDLDRDLTTARVVRWENRTGGAVSIAADAVTLVDVVFRDTEIDLGWDIDASGRNPAVAVVEVGDEAGNTAERRIEFGARPTPVGVGETCGDGVICGTGFICTPQSDETSICATSEAPEVLGLEVFFDSDDNTTATFEFSGFDENADAELVGFFIYGDDINGDIDFEELDLLVFDRQTFPSLGNAGFSGRIEEVPVPAEATWVGVVILDADGNLSGQLLDPLAPEGIAGDSCDGSSSQPCRNDLVCRVDLVCGEPTAPVLETAEVERLAAFEYRLSVTGIDPDEDVNAVTLSFLDADGLPVLNGAGNVVGGTLGFDELNEVDGDFSGNVVVILNGFTEVNDFQSMVVSVRDFSGLVSDTLTAPIPPALLPGEDCDPEVPAVGGCIDNSLCLGAVCETVAPVLTELSAERVDATPSSLALTFAGEYSFTDISGFAILFSADGIADDLVLDEFAADAIVYDDASDAWTGALEISVAAPRDVYTQIRFSVLNNAGDESNTLNADIPPVAP